MGQKTICQTHLDILKGLFALDKYQSYPKDGYYRPFDLLLSLLPRLIQPDLMPKYKLYRKKYEAGQVVIGSYCGDGALPTKTQWQYFVLIPASINVSGLESSSPCKMVYISEEGPQEKTSVYANRECSIIDWPISLQGRAYWLVQTSQSTEVLSDKSAYLKFTIDKGAEIFVAFQTDIIQVPAWLDTWEKTDTEIKCIDQSSIPGKGYGPLRLHLQSGSGSYIELPSIAKIFGEPSFYFEIPPLGGINVLTDILGTWPGIIVPPLLFLGLWTMFPNLNDVNLKPGEGLGDIEVKWLVDKRCLRIKLIFETEGTEIEVVHGSDYDFNKIEVWIDFEPKVIENRLLWNINVGSSVTEKLPFLGDVETSVAKKFGGKLKEMLFKTISDYAEMIINILFAIPIKEIPHPTDIKVIGECLEIKWDDLDQPPYYPYAYAGSMLFGTLREDIYKSSLLPINIAHLIPSADTIPQCSDILKLKELGFSIDINRIMDRYVLYKDVMFQETSSGPQVTFSFDAFPNSGDIVTKGYIRRLPYRFDLMWIGYKGELLQEKIAENLGSSSTSMRLLLDLQVAMHHKDVSNGWLTIFESKDLSASVDCKDLTVFPDGVGDFIYFLEQGGEIKVKVSNIRIVINKQQNQDVTPSNNQGSPQYINLGDLEGEYSINDYTGLWPPPIGEEGNYIPVYMLEGRSCKLAFRLSRLAAPKGYDWIRCEFIRFKFHRISDRLTQKGRAFRVVAKVNQQVVNYSPVYQFNVPFSPSWNGSEGILGGNDWSSDFFYSSEGKDISLGIRFEIIPIGSDGSSSEIVAEMSIPRFKDKGKATEEDWGIPAGKASNLIKMVSADNGLSVWVRLTNKLYDRAKVPLACTSKWLKVAFQKIHVLNDKDPILSGEPQFFYNVFRNDDPPWAPQWNGSSKVYSDIDSGDTIAVEVQSDPIEFGIGDKIRVAVYGEEKDLGNWVDPHDSMGTAVWETEVCQDDTIEKQNGGIYCAKTSDFEVYFQVQNTKGCPKPQLYIEHEYASEDGKSVQIASGETVRFRYVIPWCSKLFLQGKKEGHKWEKIVDLVVPKTEKENTNLPINYESVKGEDYALIFTLAGPSQTTSYRVVAGYLNDYEVSDEVLIEVI